MPIDESFAPEKAPKLIDLQTEMEKNNDVSLTALQPFINQFQAYVSSLLKNELGSVKREREDDDEPASLDF